MRPTVVVDGRDRQGTVLLLVVAGGFGGNSVVSATTQTHCPGAHKSQTIVRQAEAVWYDW